MSVECGDRRLLAGPVVELPDIGVGPAHHAAHQLVTLALPLLSRVRLVPGREQLPILFRQPELVAVAHVQVGAGDHAAYLLAGHHFAGLEVHHRRAGAILAGRLGQPAEVIVAAVAIDILIRLDYALTF